MSALAYLFAAGILACAAIGIVSALYLFLHWPQGPVRRWRKLRTPSCRHCAHGSERCGSDEFFCSCPRALDAHERGANEKCKRLRAGIVRGTRWCRFEEE